MTIVSVLYPQTATSRFDYGYYLQSHVPLVKSRWTPMGLEKVELFRGIASLIGGPPAFALIGALHFSSPADLQKALQAHGGEVMADIPNFTDVEPIVQLGESSS